MAIDAYGSSLERSDMGSSPTFTEVASVTSLSGPGISRDTYETTAHDGDGWRTFIGGLRDGGEVSMEINWDPEQATHASLLSDLDDTEPRDYKLVLPDDIAEWDAALILTAFEADQPVDNKLTASVTFKITGEPTLTVGSS